MNLTDLLDHIDRLDQEATKGPWNHQEDNVMGDPYVENGYTKIPYIAQVVRNENDAPFIALSRTALPQLAKALQAVLAKCASMERGVGYRVSGQHDTWDSYHEGMSDMAGYIEETITDVFEEAADRQALDQARAEDDGTRITLDEYLEADDD